MADERMKTVALNLSGAEDEEDEEVEEGEEEEGEEMDLSMWINNYHADFSARRLAMRHHQGWEEADDEQRELHFKRARVFDFGESSHFAGTGSCSHNTNHNLQFSPETERNYLLFASEESQPIEDNPTIPQPTDHHPDPDPLNSEENRPRMDLSEDLLHLIFTFLGQRDICRAGLTCRQWHSASSHEEFWNSLNFENIPITQANFVSICRRYPNVKELNLSGVLGADHLFTLASGSLRKLETLIMGKGLLSDAFFHVLSILPCLNQLSIFDASIGNGISEPAVQNDNLKDLQIIRCRAHRISVRCRSLETLSLKRSSMMHVNLHSAKITSLDLSSCHKLSDAAIRAAALTCPLLTSLDISFCACVTDETLREIADACQALKVLDASYCPNLSFETATFGKLVDLKLQSCEGITSASMSHISRSTLLEAIQLDNCGLLQSVSLDLPRLKKISLVHVRKFIELNLRSPVLQFIKVSRCSSLYRISITSSSLQKLVLQKQESLTTLNLQCKNLQELDLSDCESLKNSICDVFSDGGGCPSLKTLTLDNCESLSSVDIRSCTMAHLSLAGCRGMTSLKLSCPNLQKVNLDGCDHLEVATFSPVGLESLNLGICPKLSWVNIEAPKMTSLELKGCGVLSNATIKCPCLKSLDASFCRQFVDESLSSMANLCGNIEYLILSSCLSIGDKGLYSLSCLSGLTLLDLSYTFLINLQPVFDTCSQLKVLKLSACKYLTDSSLDALYKEGALPSLSELDLSYSSIGQSAITELLSKCSHLVHLNLNGCVNLHDLLCCSNDDDDIDADMLDPTDDMDADVIIKDPNHDDDDVIGKEEERMLEVLNCTGCPNVKRVVVSAGANYVKLARVNLNLSTNLKEVDLACSNLNTLNLSNCTSLEILKLDCPKLTNLQLLACTMLEENELEAAISQCAMLETLNILNCNKMNLEDFGRLKIVCPSLKRIQSGCLIEGSKN